MRSFCVQHQSTYEDSRNIHGSKSTEKFTFERRTQSQSTSGQFGRIKSLWVDYTQYELLPLDPEKFTWRKFGERFDSRTHGRFQNTSWSPLAYARFSSARFSRLQELDWTFELEKGEQNTWRSGQECKHYAIALFESIGSQSWPCFSKPQNGQKRL